MMFQLLSQENSFSYLHMVSLQSKEIELSGREGDRISRIQMQSTKEIKKES